MCPPISRNESTETKLSLEYLVQSTIILTTKCFVYLVIGTHDTRYACHDTSKKRSSIELMLSTIIDVTTLSHTVKLLFIVDEVLSLCLNTRALHTKNSLISSLSREERIYAEAFPVSSALGNPPKIHHWSQSYIYSFPFFCKPVK